MAVGAAPTKPEAPTPPEGNASPEDQSGDYPALFRALLVRSVESSLASIAPDDPKLDDDARERSLYALSLALDLAEAWPAASQLLLTIAPHMEMQGYWREWLEFLERALERAAVSNDFTSQARVHLHLGVIFQARSEYAIAAKHFEHCLAMAQQKGDKYLTAKALDRLAVAAAEQSDLPRARALADEVIALVGAEDPKSATAYSVLGLVAVRQDEWDHAINYYTRALAMHRCDGKPRFIAQAVRNLALAYRYAGRHGVAREYLEDAVSAFDAFADAADSLAELNSIADQADLRMNLGIEYWYLGDYQKALDCYTACEPVFVRLGQKLMLAGLANNRGLVYQELGQYAQAEREYRLGVELARVTGNRQVTAEILESWGTLCVRCGHTEDALAKWREGLAELHCLPEPPRLLNGVLLRNLEENSLVNKNRFIGQQEGSSG